MAICEAAIKALVRIAENDSDGLHMYTPQAMQAIARTALEAVAILPDEVDGVAKAIASGMYDEDMHYPEWLIAFEAATIALTQGGENKIVAWLRNLQGPWKLAMPETLADAIERGEHLKDIDRLEGEVG